MTLLSVLANINVKTTECYTCGCLIGMSEDMYNRRLTDHQDFWCPKGHQQHFVGESEEEKAKRLLREEQNRHQRTLSRVNEVERERDRLKKRVKAGVCPCCKRTFRQLALHIKHKHPAYAVDKVKRVEQKLTGKR